MAAGRTYVDLQAVSVGCKIPYSTLARWASDRGWQPKKAGRRKLYDWDVVRSAVVNAGAARQKRDAA